MDSYLKAQSKDSLCQQLIEYSHTRQPDLKDFNPSIIYHILLIISSEKVSRFLRITLQPQKFFGECMHVNTMKPHKSW